MSSRKFFKEDNNLIWQNIRNIISINNLEINLHKVKAHASSKFNNMVDQYANKAYTTSFSLALIPTSLLSISFFPLWRKLPLETHLRHFISNLSKNTGFEQWLGLYRNRKYLHLHIDWTATFQLLNYELPNNETNFKASSRKSHRLKFLIEEIPTVEKNETYSTRYL